MTLCGLDLGIALQIYVMEVVRLILSWICFWSCWS